ncbi:MAG: hypothetical protein IPP57_14340 [Candidatus Obscuribacter sp.]|nr:hypothetical protein [Candidatus Obscuribacter sp.]MBK9200906.1 hypothetical protein [Candidatus Obscuribacter sp.]MBK9771975.1 hypothetical protein [Candidatus Obscuribacter sp.]
MKTPSICLLLLPLTMIFGTLPAFADASFDAFFVKFKASVVKRDKAAVASMTKLPYLLDTKQLNKEQFIAKYDQLFPKATVKCFAKAKAIADQGSYLVFCGDDIYYFNKEKGTWQFTEIGVND